MAAVDEGEGDSCKGEAEEIEEEWGGGVEGRFDEGEGGSPDEDRGEKEDVG